MLKFNINIDYKRSAKDLEGEEKPLTNQELTEDYIIFAVRIKYREGLESQWRKTWGRVQRKLEEAVIGGNDIVELENGEYDFIKLAVRDAKFPPHLTKYVIILEDELEKLGKEE